MRKLFSIIAATFVATTMFAATATMQYTNTTTTTNMAGDGANNAELVELNPAVFTVLATKGDASNLPGLNKAKDIRLYAKSDTGNGNTITVSITGGTINSIVLDIKQTATFVVKAGSTAVTESGGAYAINGASFSIQNTTKGATTQLQLNKITIDYTLEGVTVEAPTFEPKEANFEKGVTITLACATEGASIFFTLDGSEPATEAGGATQAYSAPFTITTTATIKAIAVKGADKSTVAEKTYTKLVVKQYEVAEAIAAAGASPAEIKKDDLIMVRGVVTKIDLKPSNFAKYGSANIYVKDATGATGEFEFYNCYSLKADTFKTTTPAVDPSSTTWTTVTSITDKAGNKLTVGDTVIAKGKYELHNSVYELQQNCFLTSIIEGEGPAPVDIDIQSGVMFSAGVEEDQHFWQIQAENDDYYVTLAYVGTSTSVAGTYTEADLYAAYSYIYDYNADAKIEMASANLVVTVNTDGTEADLAGTFVGTDGSKFNLKLHYTEPKPETTVNVNIEEATLEVDTEEGLYGVMGEDATGLWVQLFIYTDEFEGEYDESDLNYESSVWFDDENYVDIYTAEIEVVPADNIDNGYRVTADLLCYNNTLYKVTMTVSGEQPSAINNVETVKSNVMKAIENGHLFINVNGVRYNVNGAIVK